jgi:hypothetical protein
MRAGGGGYSDVIVDVPLHPVDSRNGSEYARRRRWRVRTPGKRSDGRSADDSALSREFSLNLRGRIVGLEPHKGGAALLPEGCSAVSLRKDASRPHCFMLESACCRSHQDRALARARYVRRVFSENPILVAGLPRLPRSTPPLDLRAGDPQLNQALVRVESN